MPNSEIRKLTGEVYMASDPKKQLEGPLKIRFKLSLVNNGDSYKVFSSELNGSDQNLIFESRNLPSSLFVYKTTCNNLIKTNQWSVFLTYQGQNTNEQHIIFQYKDLLMWDFKDYD